MPVEAIASATGTTTMEITVSKFELLRELTATQGVVERKTTIPILSNYLFEAVGRQALAHRHRSGSEPAHLVQRQSQERRLVHHPGAQAA